MAMVNRSVVVKVVNAHEVEGLTMNGWRLDDVLQESHVEPFSESIPMVTSPGSYPQNFNATKGFAVTLNLFLMKKDGSTIVAEAHDAMAQMEKQRKELADRIIETDKALRERITEVAKLKAENERQVNETTSWIDRHTAERGLKVKMENDIAKIRQAVGELKMKEILGQ